MYLKKALRGTIIVFILSLLGGLFGYLTRILLARKLTIAEFGLFYAVITVFLFISYFIDAGLGQAVSRKIIELRLKKKHDIINNLVMNILLIQIILSALISLVIILYAPIISLRYFHADVTNILYLMCVWLISYPVISMIAYIMYGFKKSELFSVIDMLKYVSLFVFTGIGIFIGGGIGGVYAPILAYVCTNVVLIVLGSILLNKYCPISSSKFKFDKKLIIEIFNFGIMIFFSNLAWFVITQVDTMILTYFTDATQVGLYQVAVPLAALVLYVANSLSIIIFPLVTELSEKKDTAKLVEGLRLIYKYVLLFIIPIVIALFSFPDIIINIFFGSNYFGAIPVLRILAIASIFFSITIIDNVIIIAFGSPKLVARIMFFVTVLNIILNFLLIPRYGIIGAASASLASFIVAFILSSYNIKKKINITFPVFTWAVVFAIGVGMIFIINYLRSIIFLSLYPKLIVIGLISGVIYLGVLFMLRIIQLKEIRGILVQLKR